MNRARKVFLPVLFALLVSLWPSHANAAVSFDFFYSNLSPHGSWLVSAQFGHVWQPGVYTPGWNPYYDGHWADSDLGWTWVSDYGWGGIPYHYGTWVWDPAMGWVWVPGYVWAPAWVVFRTGADCIGWAPVSPGFSIGVSVGPAAPAGPFVFVPTHDFMASRVRGYVVPEDRARTLVRQTRVVNSLAIENNVVVTRGPDRRAIEQASGQRIRQVPIDRLPRVAPGPRVDRAALEVHASRTGHQLRAAEPVPASRPLPGARYETSRHQPVSRPASPAQQPMQRPQQQPAQRPAQQPAHQPAQAHQAPVPAAPHGHASTPASPRGRPPAPPQSVGPGQPAPRPAPGHHKAPPPNPHGQDQEHHG